MPARTDVDLAAVLSEVVTPCLSRLLRVGELDSVTVSWRLVRMPVMPQQLRDQASRQPGFYAMKVETIEWQEDLRLMIDLVVQGEEFTFQIATVDDESDVEFEWFQDELYCNLQDWIAESGFGWGELRGGQ